RPHDRHSGESRNPPEVAATFAVADVSCDDKRPSKAFVRKRPSYFLLSARQKKVAKEKRLFKVTSH
ncbi:hypothetical protein, partial [Lysobacter enzymogenes]|uniref:hypothetical protein n=1 Tax=Lysobacter enzymogenes TaxID=69 RepID=UPI00197B84E8